MASRSKAFEQKQRNQRSWQPPPRMSARGYTDRARPRMLSDVDMTRSVVINMDRFREILQDEPDLSIANIIKYHVQPSIRESNLSYRFHEFVVVSPRVVDSDGFVVSSEQQGLLFTFKRVRHALLFKLMWG